MKSRNHKLMPLDYGQALLKEHPDWCVGEKRVRSLNRMLNEIVDSTDTSRQNGLEHSGRENILAGAKVEGDKISARRAISKIKK